MNPLVLYGVGLAAIFAVLGGAYQAGRNSARRECDAASVRQELANAKADLEAEQRSRADATFRGSQIERQAKENEDRVRQLEDALKGKPAPAGCLWGDDDDRRVRNAPARSGPRVPEPPRRP